MKKFILGMCFIVGATVVCRAEQPVCTGDRHYDTAGNCVSSDPPGKCNDGSACTCPSKCADGQDCHCDASVTTTTTTLPGNTACGECPATTCICNGAAPTVTVVDRCPPAPQYVLCRAVKKSKKHPDGLKCKAPSHPHAVWVPVTSPSGAF